MKFEKPQKGNPHGITIGQHVFPKASMDRFCDDKGFVECNYKGDKLLKLRTDNQLFCAKRAWDQKSETGYMKSIEDTFQSIASRVIEEPMRITFGDKERKDINRFYALWMLRNHYMINPEKNEKMYPSYENGWTKDEQEQLEKAGAMFINERGEYPGRFLVGVDLFTQIGDIISHFMDARWAVMRSDKAEFVVPDRPPDFLYVPITPKLCLYSKSENVLVTEEQVEFINRHTIKSCAEYYFAKDLSKCL